jgi:hypothetical protein
MPSMPLSLSFLPSPPSLPFHASSITSIAAIDDDDIMLQLIMKSAKSDLNDLNQTIGIVEQHRIKFKGLISSQALSYPLSADCTHWL